jgi:hypothetical protein
MEPDGSLPCSQQPAIDPSLEPDESYHTLLHCFLKIHYNYRRLCFPGGFLPKFCMHFSFTRVTCLPWSDHSNNIWWGFKFWGSSCYNFLEPAVSSLLLGANLVLSPLFSDIPSLCFRNVGDQDWHPYTTRAKLITLCVFIFQYSDGRRELNSMVLTIPRL